MDFTTKVGIPAIKEGITYKNNIMLLGSCFANEVGNCLKDYRFNVKTNPFGTLYNPCSIANSVEKLATGREFTKDDVIESNGIFTTFYHHSSISNNNIDLFLENANARLKEDVVFFKQADIIIITLGTAYIYKHLSRNIIVSNCHKVKPAQFQRRLLSINECVAELDKIVNSILGPPLFCNKKIIFTVSPIRHIKDGAHANQISKSTLLLAVEELLKKYNDLHYFPAYEIVMDELRDYRFYASDMVHPSPLAVEYIFERFKESFISPQSKVLMQQALRLTKAWNHRPLFPQSKEYKEFLKKLEKDSNEFNQIIAT